MDKLSNKLKLVRSQSMGVGMGGGGDKVPRPELRPRAGTNEHGRQASIVLLDERRLEMHIQPRLYAGELLDLVASHIQLKEKEYFGLAVVDDNGSYTWLQLDRKILDHDLPRKPNALQIHFLVKFFIESICHLAENKTIELFYLQARSLIFRGSLEVEADIVFQLAALSLQASHGDHVDEASTRSLIRKSPILPANVLKDQASMTLCEDQVIEHYIKTRGQTRGQAIVNYMTIVESMPTYGVHYFEVLDKRGSLWWLGLSCRGIAQYEAVDRKTPMRVFQWKQLENLYFRDKKFSIEVHDAKRVVQTLSSFNLYEADNKNDKDLADAISESTTQVSLSRRSYNPGNIHVYVWFGKTQALTKCIWQSAISQHQFYLDRKQAKMRPFQLRTLKEIARDLTRSSLSLSSNSSSCSMSNLSQSLSESTLALTASKVSLPGGLPGGSASVNSTNSQLQLQSSVQPSQQPSDEQLEEAKRLKVEMLAALKARREALDAKLKEKNALLKELCIKEGELTGELPPEIPLNPGEPVPTIRKRVGTEFKLSEDLLKGDTKDSLRANLELELEIQNKITAAAHKLVNDPRAPKSVRKQRKSSYQQSLKRLQELEAKLNQMKLKRASSNKLMGPPPAAPPKPRLGISVPEDLDQQDLDETQADDEVDQTLSPTRSCPASPRKNLPLASTNSSENSTSLQNSPHRKSGYVGPNSSIYKSSAYRSKQFPTFAASHSPVVAGIDASVGLPLSPPAGSVTAQASSPYRSKYEVPNLQLDSPVGLYNCPQQRTSQAFSSMDDLDALASKSQKVQVHHPNVSKRNNPSSPIVRRNSANQVMMNHKYVLGQAREVMARVEAATAAVLNDKSKESKSLENLETSTGISSNSVTDLHHHSKYRGEISKTDNISHSLHNTEEYPPHQMTSRGCRDSESLASYPLPPSHRTTSTTLLPGQTYPEQPAKPITSLQDVFYHRDNFRMALEQPSKKSEKSESPPPPPLYPKKYHDVVEQRRRSGLDRPTAVAVPAIINPVNDTVQVPLESPAVDRRSKPKMEEDSASVNGGVNANDGQSAPPMKYVPYMETTKPFEMSDFYKYSTKYKKAVNNGSQSAESSSSQSSSSSNLDNNNKPPELPAKNSPAKGPGPPPLPPPPPPKKLSSLNSESVSKDLGDAFSSEMLQWYKNSQQQQPAVNRKKSAATNNDTVSNSADSNKPATLV